MNQQVCEAISRHAVVEFLCHGGLRTVEPHSHGVSRRGHEVLRAWQRGGFSRSGRAEGWKLFDLERVEKWKETGEKFDAPRPGYNPADRQMSEVHCRLEPAPAPPAEPMPEPADPGAAASPYDNPRDNAPPAPAP